MDSTNNKNTVLKAEIIQSGIGRYIDYFLIKFSNDKEGCIHKNRVKTEKKYMRLLEIH